ncbi:hypothetical protein [Streptomyces chartreusis]|uniref:hypothetical protein n=1 Tax=Streptomyces chartreusis TaxID=1969 RepID=UPI00381928CA
MWSLSAALPSLALPSPARTTSLTASCGAASGRRDGLAAVDAVVIIIVVIAVTTLAAVHEQVPAAAALAVLAAAAAERLAGPWPQLRLVYRRTKSH